MADDMLTGGRGDLDSFDRQLLGHLQEAVVDRRRRRARVRRTVGGAVAAAVVAATTAVASLTLGTPAFAIETDSDGDVTLTINRLEDADELARSLAEQGIRAQVRYDEVRAGTACTGPRRAPAFTSRAVDGALVVEIPRDSVLTRSDAVLSIVAADDDPAAVRLSYAVAGVSCAPVGPVPPPDIEPTSPATAQPSPPTLRAGVVTATTVDLTWRAPRDIRGLSGYELYLDGRLARTVSAGTLSATLSGLRPETSYQVVARSRYDDGRRSGPSNLVRIRTEAERTAAPGPVPGTARLRVSFTTTSAWDSGYVGQYTIRNPTDRPISGWYLEFDLPAGAEIVRHWNATLTRTGSHVVADPASWTKAIPAGSFVTVGFETSGTARPTGCRIDGAAC